MTNLNERLRALLHAQGWPRGRKATDNVEAWRQKLETSKQPGFQMTKAAAEALEEFGGLAVDQGGPGLEMARLRFRIDPLLAEGEEDRFAAFSRYLRSSLFPLGDAGDGHVFLAIASDGRVFALMDGLWEVGGNIYDAMETLLTGRRWKQVATRVPWD